MLLVSGELCQQLAVQTRNSWYLDAQNRFDPLLIKSPVLNSSLGRKQEKGHFG